MIRTCWVLDSNMPHGGELSGMCRRLKHSLCLSSAGLMMEVCGSWELRDATLCVVALVALVDLVGCARARDSIWRFISGYGGLSGFYYG